MTQTAADRALPPRSAAVFALGALMLAQLFWAVDKHLLTLLFQPIEADLHISDTRMGLLQGSSYAICYSLMGLPFGWAADRMNRRNLLVGGIAVWSLCTVLCGLSHNYWELLAARAGVGIGEAALTPTALSMLSDYFPSRQRGRAIGVFMMSTFVGGGGAYIIGGAVLAAFNGVSSATLPLIGSLAVWKAAFIIVGAPGFLVALLMLLVREPPRPLRPIVSRDGAGRATGLTLVGYARRHPGAFAAVWGSYTLLAFVAFGVAPWAPTMLVRNFHIPIPQAGFMIGVSTIVGGVLACLIGGIVGDRWTARGVKGAKFRLTVFWWIGAVPALAVFALSHKLWLAAGVYAVFFLLNNVAYVSGGAVVQDLAPALLRGRATAVWYFASGVLGQGFGPLATALITDHVFHDRAALPYSLLVMAVPAAVCGLLFSIYGLAAYDRARLESEAAEAMAVVSQLEPAGV